MRVLAPQPMLRGLRQLVTLAAGPVRGLYHGTISPAPRFGVEWTNRAIVRQAVFF